MSKKLSAILRAVGALGAVLALVGGVTFAALNSSVTLAGSTISTGTANLNIYNFSQNKWDKSAPGFTITGFIPGTGVDEHVYLQNAGDVALNVSAHVPTLPGAPASGDFGFSGYENVTVVITGEGCSLGAGNNNPVTTNLAALNAGDVALPCNPLVAGAAGNSNNTISAGNYKLHFDINPAVVNGSSAGVGAFDIVFTGTATATP